MEQVEARVWKSLVLIITRPSWWWRIQGKGLNYVVNDLKSDLIGKKNNYKRFRQRVSFADQVYWCPSGSFHQGTQRWDSQKQGKERGKTNVVYHDSEPDAKLRSGLKKLLPMRYKAMVEMTRYDAMAEYDVKRGDCFFHYRQEGYIVSELAVFSLRYNRQVMWPIVYTTSNVG